MKTDHQMNVTGRDGFIMAKALAYAITTIDRLPRVRQEGSDRDDMRDLLCAMVPGEAQRSEIMLSAQRHVCFEPFFEEPQDPQRHLN
jgi:hypothetical protein